MPKCQNYSYKSARYGCCNNTASNNIFVRKVSRLFRNFPDGLESFQTVHKLFTLFGNFPHCQDFFYYLETFQTNWKPSGNFPAVWKLFRTSGNFPDRLETFTDRLETFRILWKVSRVSRNFPDCLETFQTVWKLSRQSGNLPHLLTLQFSWC